MDLTRVFLPILEMKISDFLTGNEKMCKVVYSPKQHFLPAHTDMQELAASFTTVCTELETEEILIMLHYN